MDTQNLAQPRPSYLDSARRIGWGELPGPVRATVDARVGGGARVRRSEGGGFTPGFAARVYGDGGQCFVKAACPGETSFVVDSYRAEARTSALLPEAVPAPRLRWVEEPCDDWIVLGFDLVDGRMPRLPWRADELDAVLHACALTAEAMTPMPQSFADAEPLQLADLESDFEFWRKVAGGTVDASSLLPFVPTRWIERLAELERQWRTAAAGESVVHNDLRADNVLINADGRALICDWNWATLGPAWVDLLIVLADAATDGHDANALMTRHPAAADADPERIDVVLASFAGFFVGRGAQPEEPTSPSLRSHQRYSAGAVLSWLAARRGW